MVMTATEDKAKELVNQYYFSLPNNGSFEGINSIPKRWEEAKQCALIAVDAIIQQCWDYRDIDLEESYDYWQRVKKQIENSDKTFGIFTKNTYTK
jgi:hypothetical protein